MGPRAICVASAASLVTSAASASVSFAAVFEVEAIVATAATAVIITISRVEGDTVFNNNLDSGMKLKRVLNI